MKKIIYSIIISTFITSHSQGKDSKFNDSENKMQRVAVLNFKTENCGSSLGRYAAKVLNKELARLSENKIFTFLGRDAIIKAEKRNKFRQTDCYNNTSNCIIPADKRIIGLLKRSEFKTGEQKLGKYVYKEIKHEQYLIHVKIVNTENLVEIDYKERITNRRYLASAMKKIAERIVNHYKNLIKRDKKVEVKREYVVEKRPLIKKRPFGMEFDGISASFAYLNSIGKYKGIADYGYGLNLNIHARVNPFPSYLTFSLDLYSIQSLRESIRSCYVIYPLIKIGHLLPINKFRFSPYAGAGYLISIIDGDTNGMDIYGNYDYSRDYYYNPSVSAGIEIDYLIYKNYFLLLNPSYSIFFEKEEKGQFFSMFLGFRMLL